MCTQVRANGWGTNYNDPGKERSLCIAQSCKVGQWATRTLSTSSSSSPPPTSTPSPTWSQCQDSLLVRTADTDQPLLGPNQGKNFTYEKSKENPSFSILILLQVNMRPLAKGAKPFRMTTSTETQLWSRSNKATLLVVV